MVKTVSFERLISGAVLTQVIPMVVRGPPTFWRSRKSSLGGFRTNELTYCPPTTQRIRSGTWRPMRSILPLLRR